MTATAVEQIWICGRGCGKTEATAATTRFWSGFGLEVASATEIGAARQQKKWRRKLGLQDLLAVAVERRQKFQENNDGGGANFAWKQRQGGDEATT